MYILQTRPKKKNNVLYVKILGWKRKHPISLIDTRTWYNSESNFRHPPSDNSLISTSWRRIHKFAYSFKNVVWKHSGFIFSTKINLNLSEKNRKKDKKSLTLLTRYFWISSRYKRWDLKQKLGVDTLVTYVISRWFYIFRSNFSGVG